MDTVNYKIPLRGMTCATCVGRVEKAIQSLSGVHSLAINLATEVAYIEIKSQEVFSQIVEAVRRAGYDVPTEKLDFRISVTVGSADAQSIEGLLAQVPGVVKAQINLETNRCQIQAIKGLVIEKQILKAVNQAGYMAEFSISAPSLSLEEMKEKELARDRLHIIVSAILTFPLVLPMVMEPFIGASLTLSPWIQLLLATPVQFFFGARFYRAAFKALKARAGNMDLLVVLGTSSAFGLSIFQMDLHLYFESSAVIITLIMLGKYLESRAKQQTSMAMRALQKLRPEFAMVERSGQRREVSVNDLEVGDIVVVKPGERVPVDGVITFGLTQVDESMITGESFPVIKEKGTQMTGGSINLESLIKLQVTAIGAETMLAKIIHLVETAQAAKAPIQRLVDKVSAVFVPIVILISCTTILVWGFSSQNWEQALINGIAVMVIACPCALGLATPTAMMVGIGLAAKIGVLIKDAEALEVTHAMTTVVFDKTGTLTEGSFILAGFELISGERSEVLGMAASIQSGSEHPLAKAVLQKVQEEKITYDMPESVKTVAGMGLEARLHGETYLLGNKRLLENSDIDASRHEVLIKKMQEQGMTVSFLAIKQTCKVLAVFGFKDKIKAEAMSAILILNKLGLRTAMITGDNKESALAVAKELGIGEVRAEVLPQDKVQYVEDLKTEGEIVGMVGDGINDAPALAAAHVGMAMSTGTDVAMHSAGITLMRGNPLLVVDAIEISKRTYSKIRQNLFWAFVYNVIGIPLAAFGFLNPMIAGGAMALSSVSVVSNALLLKKWKPESRICCD